MHDKHPKKPMQQGPVLFQWGVKCASHLAGMSRSAGDAKKEESWPSLACPDHILSVAWQVANLLGCCIACPSCPGWFELQCLSLCVLQTCLPVLPACLLQTSSRRKNSWRTNICFKPTSNAQGNPSTVSSQIPLTNPKAWYLTCVWKCQGTHHTTMSREISRDTA